jgi:hypothetical protein
LPTGTAFGRLKTYSICHSSHVSPRALRYNAGPGSAYGRILDVRQRKYAGSSGNHGSQHRVRTLTSRGTKSRSIPGQSVQTETSLASTRVSPQGESAFYASACAGLARHAGRDWDVAGHRGSGIVHICHRCAMLRLAGRIDQASIGNQARAGPSAAQAPTFKLGLQTSTWPPSSITRYGGMWKSSVSGNALRCMASTDLPANRTQA